ncbi:MAG: bifunctional phosphoribosyl-AMP cyclohydrolase/phosphoribosyl-ATP diphosphatase HisIE [Candidatus Peribacteraceae bacterium]|jgi:phosphoribosyl-ATP pyrophosphohydrolase/phosphoribosyl-AMP cyclohydrolase
MINPSTLDWQKTPSGLLPAIVQDAQTAQVLMLGWMNEEALQRTLKTGFVTFYSRSKKRIWRKGETSGNDLRLVECVNDCDRDTLLLRAIPRGPTCHNGTPSCFANAAELPVETLGLLQRTIDERAASSRNDSYTCSLLRGGVAACGAKVLEEAEEVVRAAREEGKQRTIEEAADLLYHLLVLQRSQNVTLRDVADELRKRRQP